MLAEAALGFARAGFRDPTLILRWRDIVGPEVANLTLPCRWQDGRDGAVLTVKCEAGAAVLIHHQTRTLIERLNAYLGPGRIARLRLVPARLPAVRERPQRPGFALESAAESLSLPDALARFGRLRAGIRGGR